MFCKKHRALARFFPSILDPKSSILVVYGLFIWFLAALFFLYEFFLRAFLGSLVHDLSILLHVNAAQLSLVDAAYYVTYGAMQLPVGILVDRYGTRKVLTFAAAICAAGIYLFSFANGFYLAIFSRILMGFGSSFAFISLLMLSLNWLPRKQLGFFFGLAQLIGALGPMLAGGPLVLFLQAMHHNLPRMFVWVSLFGLFLAILFWLFVRDKTETEIDAFVAVKPVSFVSQLVEIIKIKKIRYLMLYSGTVYMPLALLGTLWGSTFLQTHGFPPATAAFINSMLWFGLAIGSGFLGLLSDLFRTRQPFLWIAALIGLTASVLMIFTNAHSILFFTVLFFVLGLAGAGQSIAFAAVAENVRPGLKGTALGLNNMAISVANLIFIPSIGWFIQRSFHGHFHTMHPVYHQHNFFFAFLLIPVVYLVSMLLGKYTPNTSDYAEDGGNQ